jgi:regulatory protein
MNPQGDGMELQGDAQAELELENRAVRLLAARDHSCAELRRKLLAKGADDEALLERVLDGLEARDYLNDQRFAEHYVASRRRKGFGPNRIGMELRERGIAGETIEEWLDFRDPRWAQRLREVAEGKYGASPARDRKEQAKRGRFLESRGFPSGMIRDYIFDH